MCAHKDLSQPVISLSIERYPDDSNLDVGHDPDRGC